MITYSITKEQCAAIRKHIRKDAHTDYFEGYDMRSSTYICKYYQGSPSTFTIHISYSPVVYEFISTFVPSVITNIILQYIPYMNMNFAYYRYDTVKQVIFLTDDGLRYEKDYCYFNAPVKNIETYTVNTLLDTIML